MALPPLRTSRLLMRRARWMKGHLVALPLLLSGCVTRTAIITWAVPYPGPDDRRRHGHVESISETVWREEGNPAAGALAGAVIGGLLGSMVGGSSHYDRRGNSCWHPSGAGAAVGAASGAVLGAAASKGSAEDRSYDVYVRFDDGGYQTFQFHGLAPFQVGEAVSLRALGLERM